MGAQARGAALARCAGRPSRSGGRERERERERKGEQVVCVCVAGRHADAGTNATSYATNRASAAGTGGARRGKRRLYGASHLLRLSSRLSVRGPDRAACAARGCHAVCTGPSAVASTAVACRGFNVIVDVVIDAPLCVSPRRRAAGVSCGACGRRAQARARRPPAGHGFSDFAFSFFGPAGGGAARRHAMVTPRAAECALLRVQLYY